MPPKTSSLIQAARPPEASTAAGQHGQGSGRSAQGSRRQGQVRPAPQAEARQDAEGQSEPGQQPHCNPNSAVRYSGVLTRVPHGRPLVHTALEACGSSTQPWGSVSSLAQSGALGAVNCSLHAAVTL